MTFLGINTPQIRAMLEEVLFRWKLSESPGYDMFNGLFRKSFAGIRITNHIGSPHYRTGFIIGNINDERPFQVLIGIFR